MTGASQSGDISLLWQVYLRSCAPDKSGRALLASRRAATLTEPTHEARRLGPSGNDPSRRSKSGNALLVMRDRAFTISYLACEAVDLPARKS